LFTTLEEAADAYYAAGNRLLAADQAVMKEFVKNHTDRF
jgi:hypothetical protein